MTYRSDRQITQDLLPVRLFDSILWHGLDDRDSENGKALLALVSVAEQEAIADVEAKRADKLLRRARRINDAILKPFREQQVHVAKFGLIIYYVLRRLVELGHFVITDGSALDQVQTALLGEDGTLTAFANIEKIDGSAQKQARKVFGMLQAEGLFKGVVWDA